MTPATGLLLAVVGAVVAYRMGRKSGARQMLEGLDKLGLLAWPQDDQIDDEENLARHVLEQRRAARERRQ